MHSSIGRLLFAKQVEQDTNSSLSATDPVTGNTDWSAKYEYDDNGNITKTTDAKNKYVEATYDHLNRITLRNYEDTAMPDVSFYYDGRGLGGVPSYSNGKTTKVTSSASETKYMTFDVFGHLLTHRQTTDGNNYDTAYSYNIAGALIEETYPSGRKVTNTLDQDGELSSLSSQKSGGISKTYLSNISRNAAGSITSMKLGTGRWENAAYNSREQIMQIGLGNSTADTGLLKLEYKYDTTTTSHDNNGSMREQKITVPTVGSNSGFTATQTYTYDDLNRLLSATENISSSQTWKQTFEYDRYGNRRFNTSGSNTTTLGSCSAAVCNPTISTSTNRISQSGYNYDANGNVTVDGSGNQFSYDAENHQKEVKDSSNNSLGTYIYDGDGRRVKKVAGSETTIFVYDAGGQMVAEYSTVTATTPQVSYLTQDHLGSPRVITNENGAVTSRKDFSAFGEESTASQRSSSLGYQAPNIRKDYTGYEKDAESGLEFAQARYYNPTHGRFTSVDPMTASATIKNPQTFNRYSYVLNSPYKFVDPLGLISQTTGACGNACRNYDSRTWGGGIPWDSLNGRGGERLPTPESESDSASTSPESGDSDFGVFNPIGTGNFPYTRQTLEELTGNAMLIDGEEVFVTISWSATVGDLFIDGTNTSVKAYQKSGGIKFTIVDSKGKEFSSKEGKKSAKDLVKQLESSAKQNNYDNVANCHGTTFADGKYWIPDDQITGDVLKKMGYTIVKGNDIQKDDVGLFNAGGSSNGGPYVHSVRFNADTSTVRSKGGINVAQSSVALTASWNGGGTLEVWRKVPKK